MKLTVERLPESQVRLDIAADEEEFAQAVEKAARKVSREIQVPGFRKGKVPRHMIESMFGREVFLEEAHRQIMDDLYRRALQQEELVPVGDPEVELKEPDPLVFSVVVPVYPTVEPGDYAGVRADPVDAAIEEGAVEEVVERLRTNSSPWVEPAEARKAGEGDQVTVDLTMTGEDGEPFQEPIEDAVFVLGESQLFDPLRAAIEDLSLGETTDVTIAFEEDDESAAERLRGKALTYTVTLKGVKARELLPLDDEFAKTYAEEETMEDLRTAIRNDLHQGRTNEARAEVVNGIIDRIAEGASIEIPAPMIDDAVAEEVNRVRQRLSYQRTTLEAYLRANDQTEEELREELRPQVAKRLRNSLVLREVAEREGIAVGDEDLEREIDDITAAAPNADQLRKVYSGDRYMRTVLRNDLFDRRLTDRLIEIATEGRGAVLNGFVPPEPAEATEPSDAVIEALVGVDESVGDQTPSDDIVAAVTAVDEALGLRAAVAGAAEAEPADTQEAADATSGDGWVRGDGTQACPDEYPIKGNESSKIFHVPGGRSYDATEPEICFATAEAAEAAGYRAAQA